MATKYVSRSRVSRQGKRVQHMKNFQTEDLDYAIEVDVMDGSGTADTTGKIKFQIDYAIPRVGAKLDWRDVRDETWTVELDGGRRITYTGVDCLKRSGFTTDREKEAVMTLYFLASAEVIE